MRIDSLDGLRGIAILLVLLFHHELFNNGWVGVDLFFVLSGFLITQILRKERSRPFFWRRFYIKRATRILPPLLLIVVLAYLLTPGARLLAALGYLFSLSYFVLSSSYAIAALGPLWSLAVEEHFYLIWPFAVRFLPRRKLFVALTLLIVTVPILRFIFSHPVSEHLSPIYFLTPFRIDGMGLGCALALLSESSSGLAFLKRNSKWLFLGSSAIYIGIWTRLHHNFFPGAHTKLFDSIGYSLVAFICCFALAHVSSNRHGLVARSLSFKPLTFVGRISYGVYLYQFPVRSLVMWATGMTSERKAFIFVLPVVLVLSWLSFRFYETPITRWGKTHADTYRSLGGQQVVSMDAPTRSADSWSDGAAVGRNEEMAI